MDQKFIEYISYYFKKYFIFVVTTLFTMFIVGSLLTFSVKDQSIFYHSRHGLCHNMFGYFGASAAAILVYIFGSAAYVFAALLCYISCFTLNFSSFYDEIDRISGMFLFVFVSSMICNLYVAGFCNFSSCGGVVGSFLIALFYYFDVKAKFLIVYALLFICLTLMFRFSHLYLSSKLLNFFQSISLYFLNVDNLPSKIIRGFATLLAHVWYGIVKSLTVSVSLLTGAFVKNSDSSIVEFEREENIDQHVEKLMQQILDQEKLENRDSSSKDKFNDLFNLESNKLLEQNLDNQEEEQFEKIYQLPDIEMMLSFGQTQIKQQVNQIVLDKQASILEEKLAHFDVKGKVVRVHPGPVITLFEYKPESNVKLSKILALEDDLAMALQAINIRILAPIPGKPVVGFEVANKVRRPVLLSNIFHSDAWINFDGNLPLILGENTHGEHIVVDLATMPHLLIAGSTGSGKSVAMNCMLVSLLCACTPEQVKFIIIDPKQLEFTPYEDIAHLLFPIITDCKRAVPVLKWLVKTMEERYALMADVGVKNIFEYHKKAKEDTDLEQMPFIVLIIDELADLMMVIGKDIEDLIARIAQMSRAAGIHMIVATQRPSVDVITGLIKVNFPNRISFKVTSKIDSRTILDEIGADRLLGKGDMLFLNAKDPDIKRVHGAYVSNGEIQYLVTHIKEQQQASYLNTIELLPHETSSNNDSLSSINQELYKEVVSVVKSCDEISAAMLQRRFRIGYTRSVSIIKALEFDGIILPNDGTKMRRVVKS